MGMRSRIQYNAHKVYEFKQILNYFPRLSLLVSLLYQMRDSLLTQRMEVISMPVVPGADALIL